MSQPVFETTEEVGAGGQIEPIHVVIDGNVEPPESTPEFGSWQTVSWPANTSVATSAQQLLPETRKRYEANILVIAGTGAAAGAFVRIGTMAQVMNNGGAQVPALSSPTRVTYHASQAVWVASDGANAATVVVLDERYL